jgi:hypothetical protein
MDMEIERLANAPWLQMSDWRVFLTRTLRLPQDESSGRPGAPDGIMPRELPPLDWPPTLFDDVQVCHETNAPGERVLQRRPHGDPLPPTKIGGGNHPCHRKLHSSDWPVRKP